MNMMTSYLRDLSFMASEMPGARCSYMMSQQIGLMVDPFYISSDQFKS